HLPPGPLRRPDRGHRRRHRTRSRAPQRGAPRTGGGRLKLQVSTVLLQWAVRTTYLVMALGGAGLGRWLESGGPAALLRDVGAVGVAAATGVALWLSFARRRAGVEGERTLRRARAARVAAMTGVPRPDRYDDTVAEFPP